MRNLLLSLINGRSNKISGLFALAIVALIALGCTCGKNFDLGNLGKENTNSTHTASNTSDDDDDTPPTKTKPSFTKADASKGEMPSDTELQDMAKTTLLDFDEAVSKEDFTEFYSTICKPWQKQTSPENMKTSFQGFIDKGIRINSIGSLDADFSPTPSIGREVGFKTLKVEGKYDTSPNKTKFELNYIPEGKEWKLSKIVVDTTQRN
jgi:hypothetical protein